MSNSSGPLGLTVYYTSTRGEIWRWYWRAWSKLNGLWKFHVFIGVLVAVAVALRPNAAAFDLRHFAEVAAIATLGCVALFPLWPQMQYKPSQRTLTINPDGWNTTVGEISGSVPWSKVQSVEDAEEAVVITGVNRNSLIVPARAFTTAAQRVEFLNAARSWQEAAHG